jgi:PhzF family phenazine biosynthesis protein
MKFPFHQVNAFADQSFAGNPAAVVILDEWLPDKVLQAIAREKNLSETAFVVPQGKSWGLRWFTPSVEIDLCGHATLAAAFALFLDGRAQGREVVFNSPRSGELRVLRHDGRHWLDFPARPAKEVPIDPRLVEALGVRPEWCGEARDLLAVLQSEEDVRALRPDMEMLKQLDVMGVCPTAPGKEVDFVCRFFAPKVGVPEDPVTGSVFCTLLPYWGKRLGKDHLTARQLSERGGEVVGEIHGNRVHIGGHAVETIRGELMLPSLP